jgi:DnaJ-class molecular chaperone
MTYAETKGEEPKKVKCPDCGGFGGIMHRRSGHLDGEPESEPCQRCNMTGEIESRGSEIVEEE